MAAKLSPWLIYALLPLLAGCASLSPEEPFGDVANSVEERTGRQIQWGIYGNPGPEVRSATTAMLAQPLTPSRAVQVALLNNKTLHAEYTRLGIGQAELVQATLPPNPIAAGKVTFADDGATNLVFGGALQVIELLRIPLKRRVAKSQLEEAKIEVAARVLGVVAEVQTAFIDYQAAEHMRAYLQGVVETERAAETAAAGLRQAGNITALDYERQNGELVAAKLELARTETRVIGAREKLDVLMGLATPQTHWRAPPRLPGVPARELRVKGAEEAALAASLELAGARQKLFTLAQKYNLTKAQAAAPGGTAGGEWEQDTGEEEAGPVFEATLPVFDWGQARKARARMEIKRARDQHEALVVRVRAAARAARDGLLAARKTALYNRSTALPQAARLMRAAQRQYNAMQIGVFELIRAKRDHMRTSQREIDALAQYWVARVRFYQLMIGTLPNETGRGGPRLAGGGEAEDN